LEELPLPEAVLRAAVQPEVEEGEEAAEEAVVRAAVQPEVEEGEEAAEEAVVRAAVQPEVEEGEQLLRRRLHQLYMNSLLLG
jgi:hypothetical protein